MKSFDSQSVSITSVFQIYNDDNQMIGGSPRLLQDSKEEPTKTDE